MQPSLAFPQCSTRSLFHHAALTDFSTMQPSLAVPPTPCASGAPQRIAWRSLEAPHTNPISRAHLEPRFIWSPAARVHSVMTISLLFLEPRFRLRFTRSSITRSSRHRFRARLRFKAAIKSVFFRPIPTCRRHLFHPRRNRSSSTSLIRYLDPLAAPWNREVSVTDAALLTTLIPRWSGLGIERSPSPMPHCGQL
jgi:hypothetical protein